VFGRLPPWPSASAAGLLAAALLGAGAAPPAAQANPRAEALLAQLPFSAAERGRIVAGELVTTGSAEQTSNRELAITMAFLIGDPPADLAARFERANDYAADAAVTAHGELRGEGSLAQLEGLRLAPGGDAEARRFAAASAGSDLNLSSAEIAALREPSGAAVEAELRRLLLGRFQAYRAGGLAGIAPYDRGRGRSTQPAEDLRHASQASPLLAREAPELVKALLEFPRAQPAQARQSFFWVNFAIDGRPTLALTHRLALSQPDGTYVLADRHYYVSRSHNAVQVVAGIFPAQEGALVLYGNRTFTDQLAGVGSGARQALGRRIMSGQLAALYEQLRARVGN
jgi:hypothetical protein